MSISINTFRNLAETSMQSKTVEVSQNRPGELKAAGFWGRLFGRAGKDATKNQQVMNEFCSSIRETMGREMEGVARQLLGEAMAGGKPLKGFMIRQVFDAVDQGRSNMAAHNLQTARQCHQDLRLDDLRSDDGTGNRLEHLDRWLDNEVLSLLEKAAADSTAIGHTMSFEEMQDAARSVVGKMRERAGADPEFMRRINEQTTVARQNPSLSSSEMQELRAVILLSGVRPGPELDAALDLSDRLMDRLSPPPKMGDGVDMMRFLEGVQRDQGEIFAARGVGEGHNAGAIFACAVQCALERADVSPETAKDLAENLFCGEAAREIPGALNLGVAAGTGKATELKSVFSNLLNGFAWRTPMDPGKTADLPLMSMDRPSSPKLAAYLFGEGLLTGKAMEDQMSQSGFALLLSGGDVPGDRLVRLMESGGGVSSTAGKTFRQSGFSIMNIHYDALAAAQPDGKPFDPSLVWNTIFREPLPDDVSGDNLAESVSRAMHKKIEERIFQDNPGMDVDKAEMLKERCLMASVYGLDPRAVLETRIGAQPGGRVLSREQFGSLQSIAPPKGSPDEELVSWTEKMAADIFRRRGDSDITIGGVAVPLKNNPLLTDKAEIENYQMGRTNNAVVRQIGTLVTEMFGDAPETKMQRAAVLGMFSQRATSFLRFLAPTLDLPLFEHSAINMNLERLDDGTARLTLQTPPGAGHDIHAVYSIGLDGTARMTDIRIADFEG